MRKRAFLKRLTAIVLMLAVLSACCISALAATPGQFTVDGNGNISMGGGTTETGDAPTLSYVLPRYRQTLSAALAVLAITMGILMTVMITKLGAAGDNPMLRRRAIAGIATTGVATALLGGLSIYIGLLWNVLAGV